MTALDEAVLVRKALANPQVWEYVVTIGKLIDIDADYIPKVIADLAPTLRDRLEKNRVANRAGPEASVEALASGKDHTLPPTGPAPSAVSSSGETDD